MQLTRRRIIATAMDMIERDGFEAVTMQRLATELGCGVLSLYSHVPSRSALLDGVADALLAGVTTPAAPSADWPAHVRAQARALWHAASAHPRCCLLVLSRPPTSTAARRPLEAALAALCAAGVAGPEAVRILRVFAAYMLGSLLREGGVAPGLADSESAGEWHRPVSATAFPHIADLGAELAGSDPDADFEFGLDLLTQVAVVVSA